ncbi:geminin coiled-coil domain-containing protein 1 isoform X1 [Danio rerio]|uniref:Geminin coiled-coil domain-containing n=2 Tax=Danio rerio TaxID=7955 RepID=E7FDS4_DANRE|nr:geminin coiled-coil domain-containing protein 1 isoform X1 [Danio rerio]|eukprot:XP_009290113.1 geminin coiled-coil domain-containing protein 1 isoform X1 [Danio rerio]
MLSCQDLSFAGGQRYEYCASTSADGSVDVSTTTLVSLWDAGPLDNAARQHEPPRRDSLLESGLGHQPTWHDQLSPQLQRNKQLQDTLMQREEELARLQEENNKLKEFLNSSYVKSLEEKSKKLLFNGKVPDVSRHRKRMHGDFRNLSQLLHTSEGKRTCRNLSLEFCSAEELAATPPLDSWVLETLGLQDENTINPERSLNTTTFSRPLPTEDRYSVDNTTGFSPNAGTHCDYSSIVDSSSNCSLDTSSGYSTSQSLGSDYSTLDPSALYTITSTGSPVSSPPALTTAQHFTPPRAASTPYRPQDVSPYYSTPGCGSSTSPGGDKQLFSTPRMSRSKTDLAFSMSLSPQNSVKTHSFPQGQAFTRRDAQGGWNFTWVPKQCS